MMQKNTLLTVGWREWLALPELGIPAIRVKVDTGARTSALHTFNLETFVENGQRKVRFGVHPLRRHPKIEIFCVADLLDERVVTNSGGASERRVVIQTPIRLGDREWPIEITLANRESMKFRMLLGRTAMAGQMLVDPNGSYLLGHRLKKAYQNKLSPKIKSETSSS
jgi:hypothetical protein